jgi:hypothetical protein
MTLWSTSPNKHGHFGLQPKSIVFGTRPTAQSNRL